MNPPQNPESLITPLDEHNQELISQVHPLDWVNPLPADRYDLVVIGAGTAGLVVAAGAAGLGLGLKIALIETHLMGGDCLNVGCVPSKCMIASSQVAAQMRDSDRYGVKSPDFVEVDFAAVMARLRKLRAGISHHDSAQRFQNLGIDVFLGQGSFVSQDCIQVNEAILRFNKAVITTGARAAYPEIPGLAAAGFLTNETVFNLTERPARLAVIGGGAIGCELAQTFQRLGSQVTLLHNHDRLMNREDPDAAEILQHTLIQDGIQLVLNSSVTQVEGSSEGKIVHFMHQGKPDSVTVNEILIGIGRKPNVETLNLDIVGVAYDLQQGVQVNDFLQTTNPRIFAAGDICLNWKYTHAADAAARIVIKNALFTPLGLGRSRLSDLVMPWCTYTDPEIAHVGLYEADAQAKGLEVDVIQIAMSSVDRAIAAGTETGFVKILHPKGSDKILGATIVGSHAGDWISEITLAIVGNIGLSKLSTVIHPYPTQAEAIKKAADAYRKKLLSPRTRTLLKWLHQLANVFAGTPD